MRWFVIYFQFSSFDGPQRKIWGLKVTKCLISKRFPSRIFPSIRTWYGTNKKLQQPSAPLYWNVFFSFTWQEHSRFPQCVIQPARGKTAGNCEIHSNCWETPSTGFIRRGRGGGRGDVARSSHLLWSSLMRTIMLRCPCEYCSITSRTSYGFLACCGTETESVSAIVIMADFVVFPWVTDFRVLWRHLALTQ